MTISKINTPSNQIYTIVINNNDFKGIEKGTLLRIDPNRNPEDGNTIVISLKVEKPTLAKWRPGIECVFIEPLESNYPESIVLEKNYKVHGVVLGAQGPFQSLL